jgi:hypothetical protein
MPAKRKKTDTAIIVAIVGVIGTLIAAIFSSPVLIALLERATPAAQPSASAATDVNQVLVFNQDFENGTTSGFAFDEGTWKIGKDKSNNVLEGIGDLSQPDIWPMAIFGPNDFTNGMVEFNIKFNRFQDEASASFHFRYNDESTYSAYVMQNSAGLGYRERKDEWVFKPFNKETERPIAFAVDTWYTIRVEARGERVSLYIDNNRIFNASDDRLQRGGLVFSLAPGFEVMIDDIKVWSLE